MGRPAACTGPHGTKPTRAAFRGSFGFTCACYNNAWHRHLLCAKSSWGQSTQQLQLLVCAGFWCGLALVCQLAGSRGSRTDSHAPPTYHVDGSGVVLPHDGEVFNEHVFAVFAAQHDVARGRVHPAKRQVRGQPFSSVGRSVRVATASLTSAAPTGDTATRTAAARAMPKCRIRSLTPASSKTKAGNTHHANTWRDSLCFGGLAPGRARSVRVRLLGAEAVPARRARPCHHLRVAVALRARRALRRLLHFQVDVAWACFEEPCCADLASFCLGEGADTVRRWRGGGRCDFLGFAHGKRCTLAIGRLGRCC